MRGLSPPLTSHHALQHAPIWLKTLLEAFKFTILLDQIPDFRIRKSGSRSPRSAYPWGSGISKIWFQVLKSGFSANAITTSPQLCAPKSFMAEIYGTYHCCGTKMNVLWYRHGSVLTQQSQSYWVLRTETLTDQVCCGIMMRLLLCWI